MKFYTLNEIPVSRDDKVFKASPLGAGIALVIFSGITISLIVLGRRGGAHSHGWDVPPFIAYWVGGLCGVCALFSVGFLRARLKATNWLLRCSQSGVIIKYRSYQNWRMPTEDVQAVGFDYSEISWARKTKERRTSPGMGGSETKLEFLCYLDLGLVNKDTSQLAGKLDEERRRPWKYRVMNYPVEVLPDGVVRLSWRSNGGGAYSNPDDALRWLSRFVRIIEPVSTKVDLMKSQSSGVESQDADMKIRQLARRGDKLGAIKLTREVYGCSLKEAKEFVEKL